MPKTKRKIKVGDLVKIKGDGVLPKGYWDIGPGLVVRLRGGNSEIVRVFWFQQGGWYDEILTDLQCISAKS